MREEWDVLEGERQLTELIPKTVSVPKPTPMYATRTLDSGFDRWRWFWVE